MTIGSNRADFEAACKRVAETGRMEVISVTLGEFSARDIVRSSGGAPHPIDNLLSYDTDGYVMRELGDVASVSQSRQIRFAKWRSLLED